MSYQYTDSKTKRLVVASARIGDLEPLVKRWMEKNPGVATSHLVRRGLKLALAPLAGKRHAHLVR